MNKVLPWIKSNVTIVVFALLIVAALILGPILSGKWNASVRGEAEERAKKLSLLDSLERTTVNLNVPGKAPVTLTTVVNPYLLREYERLTAELRADATAVRELAVTHNRKGRGALIPRIFPEMPPSERDTLPNEMYQTTLRAYRELLVDLRAGMPPAADAVRTSLESREEQYIFNTLRKQARKDLDANELKDLTEELSRARLALYGEAARNLSFYCPFEVMPLPSGVSAAAATPAQMFEWQWTYWIVDDVLRALAEANAASNGEQNSVVSSPVKRVHTFRVIDGLKAAAGGGGSGGGGGGGGGGLLGGGVPGRRGGAAVDAPVAEGDGGAMADGGQVVGGEPIDPAMESPRDFTRTFTGRVTNGLYDVRYVEVGMVVAAERLPVILNALARRNFITVVDLQVRPADAFAAAADGFIYGSEPVIDVTLTLESVWLREWTAPLMPLSVRQELKIASPTVGSPGAVPLEGGST